jgi:hypothetical protein
VALALVDIYSPALSETVDVVDSLRVVQSMAPLTFDSSRLVATASRRFGHVNDKQVRVRERECVCVCERERERGVFGHVSDKQVCVRERVWVYMCVSSFFSFGSECWP